MLIFTRFLLNQGRFLIDWLQPSPSSRILLLSLLPMAMLILLSATTRTRIIPPDLRAHFYRLLFYGHFRSAARFEFIFFIGAIFFAGIFNIFFVGPHLT